jgi:hypothetical protein
MRVAKRFCQVAVAITVPKDPNAVGRGPYGEP